MPSQISLPANKLKSTMIVVAVVLVIAIIVVLVREQQVVHLPPPLEQCAAVLSWQGLIPGQSTRQDVINALGKPFKKGRIEFYDGYISYYAYPLDGGVISKYMQDRIFFRSDGVIDWMEIIEADRDGSFHTMLDTVKQVGNELDVVYSNNTYNPHYYLPDIVAGPDRIYVWSACGLVLDVLPIIENPSFYTDGAECAPSDKGNITPALCKLVTRYPNPYNVGGDPGPDVNSVVLMKFYFQPTTYEAFTEHYMYRIWHGIWDEYIDEVVK